MSEFLNNIGNHAKSRSHSWVERNGFPDWSIAFIWIIVAFFLFQIVAAMIVVMLIVLAGDLPSDPTKVFDLFIERIELLFIGNSIGQIFFLGLATLFVARLHTSKGGDEQKAFLRFKYNKDTLSMIALGGLLIIFIQPVIWFMGWINAQLPLPSGFQSLQRSQLELIEELLKGDHLLVLTLFNVGIVPAVCEEILYRGYVMRAFEKSWGIWWAIIISGLMFGLYHLQLSNLLPLASIGIILAYMTWISESIYPAMAAHFINNGGSVLVGKYYPDSVVAEVTPESIPPVWALVAGMMLSGYIIYIMYNSYRKNRGGDTHV